MKPITLVDRQDSQNFYPLRLLERFVEGQANGCLAVFHNSVEWRFYFHQGLLTYATHSVDPFERLERHLRHLSRENRGLTAAICTEARLKFEHYSPDNTTFPPDYQAITWLVSEQYLNSEAAATLIKRLMNEVFETYLLLLANTTYNFIENNARNTYFCHVEIQLLAQEVQGKLLSWQALAPVISSPDQRPYFFSQNQTEQKLSLEKQQRLSKILTGFSFRQIAILVNQDELKIAQYLYPLINQKIVILRDPQSPFDRLPKLPTLRINPDSISHEKTNNSNVIDSSDTFNQITSGLKSKVQQKIVCVDDSPTILTEINRFLEGHNLSVHALSDSSKALMEIMRIKPDIILLDVGMPTIDGYKLCRLLRNHSLFKTTPIVMVTGNTGIVDRAKARMVGATDYLTKPFTQSELVKMVFRYLT
ncbi:response regulator [Merismopedia glauca CCAP 1448/3]|uniref:Response regulator n=2 Tax=Merismopedia TaxID=53402 RepID=A0A2T1C3Z8_9CYAN|nr:response regulator [Merismopedia glauca CCAP 1448/3]